MLGTGSSFQNSIYYYHFSATPVADWSWCDYKYLSSSVSLSSRNAKQTIMAKASQTLQWEVEVKAKHVRLSHKLTYQNYIIRHSDSVIFDCKLYIL